MGNVNDLFSEIVIKFTKEATNSTYLGRRIQGLVENMHYEKTEEQTIEWLKEVLRGERRQF